MTRARRAKIVVCRNLEELSHEVAERIVTIANECVERYDRFTIALSGGNTPRRLYELLATSHRAAIPWRKTYVFWGDERYVSPEHPQSNYRMARETLIDHVPLPPYHVHPMPTLLPEIEEAAESYEETLMSNFKGEWPRFDLILLGMGADGHIASLFPHHPVLEDTARVVAAIKAPADPPLRLTLTLPAINHAANIHMLVAGVNKIEAVRKALNVDTKVTDAPAVGLRPIEGNLLWWVDEAAMGAEKRALKR